MKTNSKVYPISYWVNFLSANNSRSWFLAKGVTRISVCNHQRNLIIPLPPGTFRCVWLRMELHFHSFFPTTEPPPELTSCVLLCTVTASVSSCAHQSCCIWDTLYLIQPLRYSSKNMCQFLLHFLFTYNQTFTDRTKCLTHESLPTLIETSNAWFGVSYFSECPLLQPLTQKHAQVMSDVLSLTSKAHINTHTHTSMHTHT